MLRKIWKGSITLFVIVVLGLIAVFALIKFSGIGHYMTLEYLQAKSEMLHVYVSQHYFKTMILFFISYIALITVLPFVVPLTLLGGFLFGIFPGILITLVAATVGSVLTFLTVRYLAASFIKGRYQAELESFDQKMKEGGPSYLLTLQLLSVIPYIVTDILAALTDIPLKTFMWTFFVGNIPLHLILVFTGTNLATVHSMHDILSPKIMIAFALLALLALAPIILKRFNVKI